MVTDTSSSPSRASALALGFGAVALVVVLIVWLNRPPADQGLTPRDPGFQIDVNRADAATLQLLPGLGPSIADNVVRHRETHGPFREPGDLEAVRMIGPVLRKRIEPWIVIDSAGDGLGFEIGLETTTPEAPADGDGSPR